MKILLSLIAAASMLAYGVFQFANHIIASNTLNHFFAMVGK